MPDEHEPQLNRKQALRVEPFHWIWFSHRIRPGQTIFITSHSNFIYEAFKVIFYKRELSRSARKAWSQRPLLFHSKTFSTPQADNKLIKSVGHWSESVRLYFPPTLPLRRRCRRRLVKPGFESAPSEKRRERAGIVLLHVSYKSDQCNLVPSSNREHPEIFAYLLLH